MEREREIQCLSFPEPSLTEEPQALQLATRSLHVRVGDRTTPLAFPCGGRVGRRECGGLGGLRGARARAINSMVFHPHVIFWVLASRSTYDCMLQLGGMLWDLRPSAGADDRAHVCACPN